MDLGIAGRRAIVCAASKGLGKGCALALAGRASSWCINARDSRDAWRRPRPRSGPRSACTVTAVAGDITTEEGRAALLAACPQPDILVNNAGGPPPGDFRDWDARRLAQGARRQHADADRADPRTGRRHDASAASAGSSTSPRRSVKAPIAEPRPVQRRPRRPDRLRRRRRAPGGGHGTSPSTTCCPARSTPTACESGIAARRAAARRDRRGGRAARHGRDPGRPLRRRRTSSARLCAFLCSAHAGYITGQNLLIDGGAFPAPSDRPGYRQVGTSTVLDDRLILGRMRQAVVALCCRGSL